MSQTSAPATRRYRIKGDWMQAGVIDNLNRSRVLDILVVDGKAYDPELHGLPNDAGRLELTPDDELTAWGAGASFLPDAGELDRVGRHIFAGA